MLRRPKHSKNEVVAPKEEEELIPHFPIHHHYLVYSKAQGQHNLTNIWYCVGIAVFWIAVWCCLIGRYPEDGGSRFYWQQYLFAKLQC